MNLRTKVIGIVVVGALVGLLLQPNGPIGQAIWPPHPGGHEPTGMQLPLLIVVSLIEALAFGAGIAFLVYGRPILARASRAGKGLTTAAFFAITWGLVSWVPHTSMHISNGPDDMSRLILIEYLFHVTLVLSAAVTALFFFRTLAPASGADARAVDEDAAAAPS